MIRQANHLDLSSILEIYRQHVFYSQLSMNKLKDYLVNSPCFLVNENNKKVNACIITSLNSPSPPPPDVIKTEWINPEGRNEFINGKGLVIDFIAVDNEYLRQGLGKELLQSLEEYVRHNRLTALFAWIASKPIENNTSLSFFKSNGFVRIMLSHKKSSSHALLHKMVA